MLNNLNVKSSCLRRYACSTEIGMNYPYRLSRTQIRQANGITKTVSDNGIIGDRKAGLTVNVEWVSCKYIVHGRLNG